MQNKADKSPAGPEAKKDADSASTETTQVPAAGEEIHNAVRALVTPDSSADSSESELLTHPVDLSVIEELHQQHGDMVDREVRIGNKRYLLSVSSYYIEPNRHASGKTETSHLERRITLVDPEITSGKKLVLGVVISPEANKYCIETDGLYFDRNNRKKPAGHYWITYPCSWSEYSGNVALFRYTEPEGFEPDRFQFGKTDYTANDVSAVMGTLGEALKATDAVRPEFDAAVEKAILKEAQEAKTDWPGFAVHDENTMVYTLGELSRVIDLTIGTPIKPQKRDYIACAIQTDFPGGCTVKQLKDQLWHWCNITGAFRNDKRG